MSSNRLLQFLLFTLALLPCAIVAVMAARIWLVGETEMLNWQSVIWPTVLLQLVSIGVFSAHASSNKHLAPAEIGNWVFQFIVYIPFGMLSYWAKHVWGQRSSLRP
jgi:hypothetical protein